MLEQQCEQEAKDAFGPFLTDESAMTTLLGGAAGFILGKSIPAIGQGIALSQYTRFAVKALKYDSTLQSCRLGNGLGGPGVSMVQ